MLSRFLSLDQLGPSRTLSSVVMDISKHFQRFLITLSFKTIPFLFIVYWSCVCTTYVSMGMWRTEVTIRFVPQSLSILFILSEPLTESRVH